MHVHSWLMNGHCCIGWQLVLASLAKAGIVGTGDCAIAQWLYEAQSAETGVVCCMRSLRILVWGFSFGFCVGLAPVQVNNEPSCAEEIKLVVGLVFVRCCTW
jgi:hypothetical protein